MLYKYSIRHVKEFHHIPSAFDQLQSGTTTEIALIDVFIRQSLLSFIYSSYNETISMVVI